MNSHIKNLRIHTIELSAYLTSYEYNKLLKYFFSQKSPCYKESRKSMSYNGFIKKGIRIKINKYNSDEILIESYRLKYIITLSRYKCNNNYLELTKISDAVGLLEEIGGFLSEECSLLPKPMECKLTRIDFTKDIYVGENISYVVDLLNRCYIPYNYEKNFGRKDNNATFTKRSIDKRKKIFELSFYDKHKEMLAHRNNGNYKYEDEIIKQAEGILRIEFRLYASRLKNMKKTYTYSSTREFFDIAETEICNIINKNLKSLYLLGSFHKLTDINLKIDASYFKEKTKKLMREFINLSALHKNAHLAATEFEDKYGEKILKNILQKFNRLGIIPVPISVRQNFDEWGFMD